MPAYLIIGGSITDHEKWIAYRKAVLPILSAFGAELVTKAGTAEMLEGQRSTEPPMAMFRFSSIEQIRSFWTSAEYTAVKQIRRGAASLSVWAVDGNDRYHVRP